MVEKTMTRRVFVLLILSLLGPPGPRAQAAPKLVSVYPLGGQRGTVLEVEVRGSSLEGTSAVWLGSGSRLDSLKAPSATQAAIQWTKSPDGLEAHVEAVPDSSHVKVQLVIAPNARVGFHTLHLISPTGLSGALAFWVGPNAVLQEIDTPHNTPDTAQPVKLPVAVNGRIVAGGELDFYSFEIAREETVAFEVIAVHGTNFDPQLALYETGGSFLDPQRSRRLVFQEEISEGGMPANRRMTYHFTKTGRYLVNLGNLFAQSSNDSSYLLRIAPTERLADSEGALAWARRRLEGLRSRTVEAPSVDVHLVSEGEPSDQGERTTAFSAPAVLEGTIGHPGDIDRFRFKAKAGQQLAFELQTPRVSPPHFNPRLDVLDATGAVVLSSLRAQEGKVGTETSKVIQLASELVGKFDREGEYTVRVRDLTSIQGSPDHVYRVLVRPAIPHIGTIQVQPNGPYNLAPGAKQRLALHTQWSEGYSGSLAISVEGLPQGVRAFVGPNNSVIELFAEASAPETPMPHLLRIYGLPLVDGKSGSPFRVGEIPIMVVKK
jgi:hypothetical protein